MRTAPLPYLAPSEAAEGYFLEALDWLGMPTHDCAASLPPPIAATYSPWLA